VLSITVVLFLYFCQSTETKGKDERGIGSDVSVPGGTGSDYSYDVGEVKLSSSDTVQRVEEDTEGSCDVCVANETTSSSSLQDCSLNCGRDDTCTGFNIKNAPVITWHHLYWLQRQELTCNHVLASTPRTHSSVMCTTINRGSRHLSQPACSTRLLYQFKQLLIPAQSH